MGCGKTKEEGTDPSYLGRECRGTSFLSDPGFLLVGELGD